jgi:two-component system, sensor histidine kinase RpfC
MQKSVVTRLFALSTWRQRLANTAHDLRQRCNCWTKLTPDELKRERGQALVRILVSAIATAYLVHFYYPIDISAGVPYWLTLCGLHLLLSVGVALHLFRDKVVPSSRRRTPISASDIATISFVMIDAGTAAVPLFALYLGVTLSNGLRFGPSAMVTSALLSVLGFGAVLMLSPAWNPHSPIALGIMALLLVMPMYVAHLLRRRSKTQKQSSSTSDCNGELERPSAASTPNLQKRVRLKRHDELGREQGQAIVRVVIVLILLIYLTATHYPIDFRNAPGWLMFTVGFLIFSTIAAIHAFRDSKTSIPRRTATNIGDITTISYLMVSAGEAGVPFFVLYLWVTLGNGFRFGLSSLAVSTAFSLIGFTAVVFLSPVWQAQTTLAAGIFAGLIMIPGYTAHLIRQLHDARRRAEEASAAKSEFLARMSHELRTPLNGILGATELLDASRRLTHEDRSLLGVIRDSAHASLKQIGNVLDFSKIEAGKLTVERIEIDLHDIVRQSADMVRPLATQKELRFIVRISPDVPFTLVGDPQRLRDVLLNLLSNAVKFTENGSVYLEVCVRDITENRATIGFEVRDTGIGIAPDAIKHIFDAFAQEDVSTTRRYGGTGLGTTIAKQLVQTMGGEIGVQSVKDQGTLFWFDIPFERRALPERLALPNGRALLVSESPSLVAHYTKTLSALEANLVRVSTSEDAVAAIARALHVGNSIHAIFIDATLALRIAGEHRFDYLCGKANAANIPVILIGDDVPSAARLREWGYAATLPALADEAKIFAALRASSVPLSKPDDGVVKVAPWLWTRREGGTRVRLLVADDNGTNLMIIKRMLEHAGFDVDARQTGEEALESLMTGNFRLAILDMHMPGLDGLTVLRRYRLMSGRGRVPIIILTANVSLQAQQESAEAGADAYLSKPVSSDKLLCEVERLLGGTEVHRLPTTARNRGVADISILETDVLAELDRLYHDPHELRDLIQEYEKEGLGLLQKLQEAFSKRNHPAFCDLVHALKGNAANVGAAVLMHVCNEIESAPIVEFRTRGNQMLIRMQAAFDDSISALRNLLQSGSPTKTLNETSGKP